MTNGTGAITRAAKKKIKHTLEEIEIALTIHRGNITKAAGELNVESVVLRRKIRITPRLTKCMEELKAIEVDNAKQKVFELVDEKNPQATIFVLRTLGKDEGFTEKNTIEHELGSRSAAALIAEMKRGSRQITEDDEDDQVIDVQGRLVEEKQDANQIASD